MSKKVIGLRAGHSPNCRGANVLRDEWSSMNTLYQETAKILRDYGHTVIDCNSKASTENAELREGANKANAAKVDLFISLHMNASANHNAFGTEAWIHSRGSRALPTAQRLVNNYASLGFYNRGVKYDFDDGDLDFYEMRGVDAPNIIFETCFCDSERDISIWSPIPWEKLARAIANAIDPDIPLEKPEDRYQIRIYAFDKAGAEAASAFIKEQKGWYHVVERI